MAVFSLKIAPKHDTKNLYPPVPVVTAEMGGFSMIGGTMPRMSKKRKQEWALFLNDRNRITHNTAETLLAVITAFSAKFVVGNAVSFIQKQCPLLFPFPAHFRHINPPFRLKIKKPQERYLLPCFCHFSGRKSGKIAFLSLSKNRTRYLY